MQYRNETSDRTERSSSSWQPFSWRRMNSRQAWILAAVALAFVVIGLVVL